MKNVLGIVGSPRKNGNTFALVASILEGAEAAGAQAELVFLKDLHIKECDGCHVCWTGKECSKDDDMNALYPRIVNSDVIVFGTPVYWYGPTALMKGLIDRLVYFNCPENHAKIKGKSALLAVSFEEQDPDAASLLVQFFDRCFQYLEMNLAGKILVPGITKRGEVSKKPECLAAAFDLGKRAVQ